MNRNARGESESGEAALLKGAVRAWAELTAALVRGGREPDRAEAEARRAVQVAAFLRLAEARGVPPPGDGLLSDDAALWAALPEHLKAPLAARFAPAEAGALPVEILGRIHQALLGRAKRRLTGVFYTPAPIAAYIVGQAIGRELPRGSVPRILDPACGCGAFLLAAAGRLAADFPPRAVAAMLHGVDLDPEAVLIARRSLWLEMGGARGIEGLLQRNVCCGDALLGPPLDEQRGRLDAVIGNPPYRRELGARELLARLAGSELGRRCRAARMDLSYYFLHRGLELLRPGGRLSFIVGSYWTSSTGAAKLIAEIRDSAHVEEIVRLDGQEVFRGVAGRHLILTLRKGAARGPTVVRRSGPEGAGVHDLLSGRGEVFSKTHEQLFVAGRIDLEPPCDEFLSRLEKWPPLGSLGLVRQGIAENPAAVRGEGVFALRPEEAERLGLSDAEQGLLRPYHVLADLGRHWMAEPASRLLIYSTRQTWPEEQLFPRLLAHLARFRPLLESRRETRQGRRAWWHLHWPRAEWIWQSPKVISVQMGRRPAFVAAQQAAYVPFSANVFVPSAEVRERLDYFAAVLNSGLLWEWYRHRAKHRGVGLEINGHVLARTPIRRIDFADPADRARHDRIVALVGRRRKIERQHRAGTATQSQLDELDAEIDRIVDELYAPTP